MDFNTKYPDFFKIFSKNFEDLNEKTRTSIAAEWAVVGDWGKVDMVLPLINPFIKVGVFENLNWHAWLLTRQDEKCFERWQKIRRDPRFEREGTNQDRGELKWATAASLLAYANQPELLKRLEDDFDWTEEICPGQLFRNNKLIFKSAASKTDGPCHAERAFFSILKKDEFEGKYDETSGADTFRVGPFALAGYHASKEMMQIVLDKKDNILKEQNYPMINGPKSKQSILGATTFGIHELIEGVKLVMRQESYVDMKPFYEMFNKEKIWSTQSATNWHTGKLLRNAAIFAMLNMSEKGLSEMVALIDDASVKDIMDKSFWYDWNNAKGETVLNKGDVEKIDAIKKLYKRVGVEFSMSYTIRNLWNAIEKNKLNVVKVIIESDAYMLEETDWIYENRNDRDEKVSGSKKGTALAWACRHGNSEIAKYLIGIGADTKCLKDIMKYKPFMNSKDSLSFKVIAEKLLLQKGLPMHEPGQKTKSMAL